MEKIKRCPKGMHRNESGICEPKRTIKRSLSSQNINRTTIDGPVKIKRCPKGMYRNESGICEPKRTIKRKSLSSQNINRTTIDGPVKIKRCPKGMHRNESGICEPKRTKKSKSPIKQKSKSPIKRKSKSPMKRKSKSPMKRKSIINNFLTPTVRKNLGSQKRKSSVNSSESSSILKNKKNRGDENSVLTPKILNFYKENATPIMENSDIHPGDDLFKLISVKYLEKRYNNFLFLTNSSGMLEKLSFFVLDNNKNMMVTNVNGSESYLSYKNSITRKETYFNSLIDRIKKFLLVKKRFFIINIKLDCIPMKSAHANILIHDKKKNTLELFDPHGAETNKKFRPGKVRKFIEYIFSQVSPGCKFFKSVEINPYIGLQSIENYEYLDVPGEISGYCGAWTQFYLQMRLANPDISQLSLIEKIKMEIREHGSFSNMIRNYVKYIVQGGYRHKYNIEPTRLNF